MVNYCVAVGCTNIPSTYSDFLKTLKLDPSGKSRCKLQELNENLLQLPIFAVNILLETALSQILCQQIKNQRKLMPGAILIIFSNLQILENNAVIFQSHRNQRGQHTKREKKVHNYQCWSWCLQSRLNAFAHYLCRLQKKFYPVTVFPLMRNNLLQFLLLLLNEHARYKRGLGSPELIAWHNKMVKYTCYAQGGYNYFLLDSNPGCFSSLQQPGIEAKQQATCILHLYGRVTNCIQWQAKEVVSGTPWS